MPKSPRSKLAGIALLALVIGVGLLFSVSRRRARPEASGDGTEAVPSAGAPLGTAAHKRPIATAIAAIDPAQRLGEAERAKVLGAIRQARQQHTQSQRPGPAAAKNAADDDDSGLDKDYLRERMRDIIPLVKQCYDLALEKDPNLQGKLVVRFNIVAEPEIGGLVASSELEPGSPLAQQQELGECVRETMYALRLKAPKNGGEVVVTYPFVFATDGPPKDDEASKK